MLLLLLMISQNNGLEMPRNYKRKLGSRRYRDYSDETSKRALNAIKNKVMTQRQAEAYFKIPIRTLKNKLKGLHQLEVGGQTVLDKPGEEALTQHCIVLSDYGIPLDTFDLRCLVKSFIDKKGYNEPRFKENFPGKEWTTSFLKRNKALSLRFSANIKKKRAAISEDTINEFFYNLTSELKDLDPSNIWNYDETNLTDDPGNKKIVCKRGCIYPERLINTSKAAISLMYCGNAVGELLPPYDVYKAEHLWSTWKVGGPKGTVYNRSKSGWFDSHIFQDWYFKLVLPTLKKQTGKKVIMGDNLSSQINPQVIQLCMDNNIAFICLPQNSPHLTKPLDVAFYRPMKMAWRKVLSDWKRKSQSNQSSAMPKDKFPQQLSLLHEALEVDNRAAENLRAGFRKTGIFPINRNETLKRLPSKRDDSSLISKTFIEKLADLRSDRAKEPRKKKKKLNAPPGVGITGENLQASVSEAATKEPIPNNEEEIDLLVEENEELEKEEELDSLPADELESEISVGDFVIVEYEEELFPGRVDASFNGEAEVSVMVKSGNFWRWPRVKDQIHYRWPSVQQKIMPPEPVNNRGCFRVPELESHWKC